MLNVDMDNAELSLLSSEKTTLILNERNKKIIKQALLHIGVFLFITTFYDSRNHFETFVSLYNI